MDHIIQRQTLTNVWSDRFADFRKGYFLTLNSKMQVDSIYDSTVMNKVSILKTKVQRIVGHLNEYCYGRRYLRREQDAELLCLAFFEVGEKTQMVHAHLVAAHNGSTDRSVDEVHRFTNRKWKTEYQYSGNTTFVDVATIDVVKDRIWYCTKQSVIFQRVHGEGNIEPI